MLPVDFAQCGENPLVYKVHPQDHVSASTGPMPFETRAGVPVLSGETSGHGPPIVLLHGLTASRRYVLLGSRLLERRGHRLVAYDARGHGESSPAPDPGAYEYGHLVSDLARVLDHLDIERAVLAGSSMGAATAMVLALRHPERVAALVQITPAYAAAGEGEAWGDSLADGLERDGVDGFLAAYHPAIGERWREVVMTFTRQRLERNRHLEAVAHALRVVPRSRAFDSLEDLRGVEVPTLVVASRDESDPGHPLAVAEAYVERLPDAELVIEKEGEAPIAWRGAQVSRAIADFLQRRL